MTGDVFGDRDNAGLHLRQIVAVPGEIEPAQVPRVLSGLRHHHLAHSFSFREQVVGVTAYYGNDILLQAGCQRPVGW